MDQVSQIKVYEKCIHRHWCPKSETYTGADSLLTAQYQGWKIVDCTTEKVYGSVLQGVTIYVFTLQRHDEYVVMHVIANPYVESLTAQLNVTPADRGDRENFGCGDGNGNGDGNDGSYKSSRSSSKRRKSWQR